jgi:hypothetical protein
MTFTIQVTNTRSLDSKSRRLRGLDMILCEGNCASVLVGVRGIQVQHAENMKLIRQSLKACNQARLLWAGSVTTRSVTTERR